MYNGRGITMAEVSIDPEQQRVFYGFVREFVVCSCYCIVVKIMSSFVFRYYLIKYSIMVGVNKTKKIYVPIKEYKFKEIYRRGSCEISNSVGASNGCMDTMYFYCESDVLH